jgi:hypothetical protein
MVKRHDTEIKGQLCIVLLRRQFGDVPQKCWQLPKYKFYASREFKAINRFGKKYGLRTVVAAVLYNTRLKSLSDFAQAEVFLQTEANLERLRVLAKDSTTHSPAKHDICEDIREQRTSIRPGLFARLDALGVNNGEG